MSRADYDDPLYRECIPVRITPPPPSTDGPTAQWIAAQQQPADVIAIREAS